MAATSKLRHATHNLAYFRQNVRAMVFKTRAGCYRVLE
jgi:hypothetical protein